MALTMFWRCEGLTLDATHDFTAGDSVADGSAPSATAVRYGTNGLLLSTNFDVNLFDPPTGLIAAAAGCFAFWVQFPVALQADDCRLFTVFGASGNNNICIRCTATNEVYLQHQQNGGSTSTLATTAVNMAVGNWYFIVARWDSSANDRRVEVYNSSMALIEAVQDLTTSFSASLPGELGANIQIGIFQGNATAVYFDNVFMGSTYAEPFETKATITSYTQYSGSAIAGISGSYMRMRLNNS